MKTSGPSELSSGKYFWRIRGIGKNKGDWSKISSFTLDSKKMIEKICLKISPEKPLFILNTGNLPPENCWGAVPENLKPYTALRVWMGRYGLRGGFFKKILEPIREKDIPCFLNLSQLNSPPLALIEKIFQEYPSVKGCFLPEWETVNTPERRRYTLRLVKLAHRYGRLVVFAEHESHGHWYLKMGIDKEVFETLNKYKENVVLLWKQNCAYSSHICHSSVLGLWLAGASNNWGVNCENWYWHEAGFGRLEEAAGHPGTNTQSLMPDVFLGIMMLLGALSGATVYSIEDPTPFTKRGALSPSFSKVMLPLFEKFIQWKLIPSKKEVLSNMPLVYQIIPEDTKWDKDYGRVVS